MLKLRKNWRDQYEQISKIHRYVHDDWDFVSCCWNWVQRCRRLRNPFGVGVMYDRSYGCSHLRDQVAEEHAPNEELTMVDTKQ